MADAITYDLKFSTIQLKEFRHGDITPESPHGMKEITYKNVSPVIGGQKSRAKAKRGFCAGRCFLITLCAIFLTSLTAIIALSTQLFQASQRIRLEELRQERGGLNSSLSGDIHTKESVVRELRESLTQTEEELKTSHIDLQKSREEGKEMIQNLERTLQEKEDTEITVKELRGDLMDAGNKVQEKEEELIRCEDNLESVNLQKRDADQTISHMRNSLSDVRQKLKIQEDSLSKKDRELDDTKKTINQVQQSLRNVQEQLKKLSNLEERLSDLEEGLGDMEEELSDLKKKLGGAAQCFRKSYQIKLTSPAAAYEESSRSVFCKQDFQKC
ncbi:trichohyalin-like [Rana temporaria]|uniref:trichohyalin-like n=1 Tax=Rana temporaria TaxID=8407 RepID=UPI001AAE0748|nr:trichohyalin-like [Rana temporaria]